MAGFQAQILTPNGSLFEGEVTGVQMPGILGSFEVQKQITHPSFQP